MRDFEWREGGKEREKGTGSGLLYLFSSFDLGELAGTHDSNYDASVYASTDCSGFKVS